MQKIENKIDESAKNNCDENDGEEKSVEAKKDGYDSYDVEKGLDERVEANCPELIAHEPPGTLQGLPEGNVF
jgi:hypothetical protein